MSFERLATEYSVAGAVSFDLYEGRLCLVVGMASESYAKDEELQSWVAAAVAPILKADRAQLVAAEVSQYHVVPPYVYQVTIEAPTRGRTVGDLYQLGERVESLLGAAEGGNLSRASALDLLKGGRADVLVGQPEGRWLDVKSQDYDLTGLAGKVSLAQDVARFANAEDGGIVVIGMDGKKIPGGEIIKGLQPIRGRVDGTRQYWHALDHHLYPIPDGVTIDEVPSGEGVLVVIHVPPQQEELKPFLVHGALVGIKGEGSFISIVRRRDEHSVPITAAAIHSTLVAGRALLRRGQLPAPDESL